MKYVVDVVYTGNTFWLRGSAWTSDRERADEFVSVNDAELAKSAAARFKPKRFMRNVTVRPA